MQQIAVDTVLNVCETCHCLLCFNLLFGCFFYSICDLFCYLCFFCWICYPGNLLQIFVVAFNSSYDFFSLWVSFFVSLSICNRRFHPRVSTTVVECPSTRVRAGVVILYFFVVGHVHPHEHCCVLQVVALLHPRKYFGLSHERRLIFQQHKHRCLWLLF